MAAHRLFDETRGVDIVFVHTRIGRRVSCNVRNIHERYFAHTCIDINNIDLFEHRIFDELACNTEIAAADDKHALGLCDRMHRPMRHRFMVDRLILFHPLNVAVEHKDVSELVVTIERKFLPEWRPEFRNDGLTREAKRDIGVQTFPKFLFSALPQTKCVHHCRSFIFCARSAAERKARSSREIAPTFFMPLGGMMIDGCSTTNTTVPSHGLMSSWNRSS